VPAGGNHIADVKEYDVIIVGGGFSGSSVLYCLDKQQLEAHIFSASIFTNVILSLWIHGIVLFCWRLLGDDFGGVWYSNRYPGARVDS
jgi:hypothetical protein